MSDGATVYKNSPQVSHLHSEFRLIPFLLAIRARDKKDTSGSQADPRAPKTLNQDASLFEIAAILPPKPLGICALVKTTICG